MFDHWKLTDFAPGEGVARGAFEESFAAADWLEVEVPGDVHHSLYQAGRLADPFYDRNETECRWIEEREWWYRTQFYSEPEVLLDGTRLKLVFHGLDTFATIWLNGQELGRHANMFVPAEFDVTERLRAGADNTLAICFDRPLDHADLKKYPSWGINPERVGLRKAQFGFGWDWGPRLPTVGIWRPVELKVERGATLRSVHCATLEIEPAGQWALLKVQLEAELLGQAGPMTAQIRLKAPGATVDEPNYEQTVSFAANPSGPVSSVVTFIVVDQPQLWWTHDLGTPNLYELNVTLLVGNRTVEEKRLSVGIRTITLDQSPDADEPGSRFFRFVLNGVPIFARGANWIPADSFIATIPHSRYAQLLTAASEANMNMLRVWGGGFYEHESFYQLCDELGLLVWQDFMFACGMYPESDPAFRASVEAEALYQVDRLRNHPCLALWCGNNENQWLHDLQFWEQPHYPVPGTLFYHDILPRIVAERDSYTPYWPGSPYGGNDYNSMEEGDRHNWDVWHGNRPFQRRFGEAVGRDSSPEGVSFRHYAADQGRFISEFGLHAAPVLQTLRQVVPADQLYQHSPALDHHNKDNPKNKGDNLMLTVTGLPADLEQYIDYSMIAQAEGLKFAIEHYRRRKPHCSGTLVWQLNDCWPGLSWSMIDYYGVGKAGYSFVRRAYAPLLASFKEVDNGELELWLTNDTTQELRDQLEVSLVYFGGETRWLEERSVAVAANGSGAVARWAAWQLAAAKGGEAYLVVRSRQNLFDPNYHFFQPFKDLKRSVAQPEVLVEAVSTHELEVTLIAPAFCYFVTLLVEHPATTFSDNYFNLEKGETRRIRVYNPTITLDETMLKVEAK